MDRCAFADADSLDIDSDFCRRINSEMAVIPHEIHYLASGNEGDEVAIGDWLTPYDKKCRAQGSV
jgi:acyl-CoA thioester hydrolase